MAFDRDNLYKPQVLHIHNVPVPYFRFLERLDRVLTSDVSIRDRVMMDGEVLYDRYLKGDKTVALVTFGESSPVNGGRSIDIKLYDPELMDAQKNWIADALRLHG